MAMFQLHRCFHLYNAVICLTYVNVNIPLTHFYGFCEVTVAERACPVCYVWARYIPYMHHRPQKDGFK